MKKYKKIESRRGQMKIQQMAFMLIAVTLFFVIAGMFILVVRFSSLKGTASLLNQENAMLLVSKIADSPEFACGSAFDKPRTNCINTDKLMALKNNLGSYNNFWGINGLEVRWISSARDSNSGRECTQDNYPDCGKITLVPQRNGTSVGNFVSLCRKEMDSTGVIYSQCNIGRVIATYNG